SRWARICIPPFRLSTPPPSQEPSGSLQGDQRSMRLRGDARSCFRPMHTWRKE
ncbi:unnamed protein product, partial [Closterium sp. Naga37s-1]